MEESKDNIQLFTLKNHQGTAVKISSYDASIVSVMVPDKDGGVAEVVYSKLRQFIDHKDNKSFWSAKFTAENSIEFITCQKDREGSASKQMIKATYIWREDNTLELYINYHADSDLSSIWPGAASFDLNGINEGGNKAEQHLYLNCEPTKSYSGSDPDRRFIKDWQPDVMNEALVLASARTGRQLNVYTTLPCVMISSDMPVKGFIHKEISIQCVPFADLLHKKRTSLCYEAPSESIAQLIFYEFRTFTPHGDGL